jgi:hypothetical protein
MLDMRAVLSRYSCKKSLILPRFNQRTFRQFSEKLANTKFHGKPFRIFELLDVDKQTYHSY